MQKRTEALEEEIAHLVKTVDELSEVVARQDQELKLLRGQMDAVLEVVREASEAGGSVVIGDRPPHW